jgi:hypothetical protein
VTLERQPFELVPLSLVDALWTESGRETVRDLNLRALRSEPLEALTGVQAQVRSREQ